jgi:hypothetical protein
MSLNAEKNRVGKYATPLKRSRDILSGSRDLQYSLDNTGPAGSLEVFLCAVIRGVPSRPRRDKERRLLGAIDVVDKAAGAPADHCASQYEKVQRRSVDCGVKGDCRADEQLPWRMEVQSGRGGGSALPKRT